MGSRPARIYSILDRIAIILSMIIWIAAPVLIGIYIVAQTLFLTFPLYVLEGDARGFIGVTSYSLEIFRSQIRSPALNTIATHASPIVISIIISVAVLAIAVAIRKSSVALWMLFGASSVDLIASSHSQAMLNIISLIARQAASDFSHKTSAGSIYFQGSTLQITIVTIMPTIAYASALLILLITSLPLIFRKNDSLILHRV